MLKIDGVFDPKPKLIIGKVVGVSTADKLYDTATLYDKAIPYYGAVEAGVTPKIDSVKNTITKLNSVSEKIPNILIDNATPKIYSVEEQ